MHFVRSIMVVMAKRIRTIFYLLRDTRFSHQTAPTMEMQYSPFFALCPRFYTVFRAQWKTHKIFTEPWKAEPDIFWSFKILHLSPKKSWHFFSASWVQRKQGKSLAIPLAPSRSLAGAAFMSRDGHGVGSQGGLMGDMVTPAYKSTMTLTLGCFTPIISYMK